MTVDWTIEGRVGRVTLNRPQVLNAADEAWVRDLNVALERVASSDSVKVVLLSGRGSSFCSGIDLTVLGTGAIGRQWFADWERAMSLCEDMPKLVVCGIHGYCIGGGLQLALACDIRICTTDAKLGLPAVKECLIPGMGVWRVPRYAGLGLAKRMILAGEMLDAREAQRAGLVDYLVKPKKLEAELEAFAERSKRIPMASLRHCKRLVNTAFDLDREEMLRRYLDAQDDAMGSAEHREAMLAWREKREPDFDRLPEA